MEIAELDALEEELTLTEEERVILWRVSVLERAGYDDESSTALALRRDVDLHVAVEIVSHGCPHETAVRILL